MSRTEKIEKAILDRMWKNGGHWVELNMHSGDSVYIQRMNYESYENLKNEKFRVLVNGEKVTDNIKLGEVSNLINSNY